jgi:hypothetical protein
MATNEERKLSKPLPLAGSAWFYVRQPTPFDTVKMADFDADLKGVKGRSESGLLSQWDES